MSRNSPSVLIVRLDAIGDAITLVPLIAALRGQGARVGAVLRPANADVFSGLALDCRHIAGGSLRTFAAEIEARRYDYALIATEKPLGYRIAAMARIPVRVGFENGWGKPLKTLWVRRLTTQTIFRTAGLDPRAPHECEIVFSLAQTLLPQALAPSRDANVLRKYLFDAADTRDSRVAFQVTDKWERLGAGFDDVIEFAGAMAAQYDVRWVSSEAERGFAQRFARATRCEIEYFGNVKPWKESIAAARALVAPDSGAVHIAGMGGTPVVACFAGANFELQTARWSPWAAPYELVRIAQGWPAFAFDALGELLTDSRRASYKG